MRHSGIRRAVARTEQGSVDAARMNCTEQHDGQTGSVKAGLWDREGGHYRRGIFPNKSTAVQHLKPNSCRLTPQDASPSNCAFFHSGPSRAAGMSRMARVPVLRPSALRKRTTTICGTVHVHAQECRLMAVSARRSKVKGGGPGTLDVIYPSAKPARSEWLVKDRGRSCRQPRFIVPFSVTYADRMWAHCKL